MSAQTRTTLTFSIDPKMLLKELDNNAGRNQVIFYQKICYLHFKPWLMYSIYKSNVCNNVFMKALRLAPWCTKSKHIWLKLHSKPSKSSQTKVCRDIWNCLNFKYSSQCVISSMLGVYSKSAKLSMAWTVKISLYVLYLPLFTTNMISWLPQK